MKRSLGIAAIFLSTGTIFELILNPTPTTLRWYLQKLGKKPRKQTHLSSSLCEAPSKVYNSLGNPPSVKARKEGNPHLQALNRLLERGRIAQLRRQASSSGRVRRILNMHGRRFSLHGAARTLHGPRWAARLAGQGDTSDGTTPEVPAQHNAAEGSEGSSASAEGPAQRGRGEEQAQIGGRHEQGVRCCCRRCRHHPHGDGASPALLPPAPNTQRPTPSTPHQAPPSPWPRRREDMHCPP